MQDCFKLLHFHLGSQIPNIRIVKGALNEAARVYIELVKAGAGPRVPRRRRRPGRRLRRLADQLRVERELHARRSTPTTSSTTSRRCATTPACRTRRSCRRAAARSSRTTACWSSTCSACRASATRTMPDDGQAGRCEQPLIDLIETYHNVTAQNVLESYHDAQQALDKALNLFTGGYLPLEQRCHGREPVLGDLRASCSKLVAADGRRARGAAGPRRARCRTPTSATSRCSSRCPTAGRSSSCSRSCRSTG